jgi:hypothetical protein
MGHFRPERLARTGAAQALPRRWHVEGHRCFCDVFGQSVGRARSDQPRAVSGSGGFENNTYIGSEQFLRRDLSVWATANGRCTYGQIEVRGPLICFIYEDNPDPGNCWTPFVQDGDLVVAGVRGDLQRITQIERRDISCEGAPLS